MLPWQLPKTVACPFFGSFLLLLSYLHSAESIGCFACHSVNKSNPLCEDPFNGIRELYKDNCHAGRKNRSGVFPGTSCIKFTAWLGDYTVVVRDCTVDNGDTTSDTEMGRESHCWMVNMVNYNDVNMHGCALACHTDGCNAGSRSAGSPLGVTAVAVVVVGMATRLMMTSSSSWSSSST